MSVTTPETPDWTETPTGVVRSVQSTLHRKPTWRLAGLLTPPLGWMLLIYLIPLFLLFVTAFWTVDNFTFSVVRGFTLENFRELFTEPVYYGLVLRTIGIAAAVTVLCGVIALPMSYFMARVATPRWRPVLVALVLVPLWASYLVKVYAWRVMLNPESGFVESVVGWNPGYGLFATVLVLTYLWLPYMILPVYTAMTVIRPSMIDAAADLGAGAWRTFKDVILPIIWPSLVAGSIFTFSLSLGDYITVQLVGGTAQMLGNAVYQNFSVNLPFAAALATLPVLIMTIYLLAVRRTGALENL